MKRRQNKSVNKDDTPPNKRQRRSQTIAVIPSKQTASSFTDRKELAILSKQGDNMGDLTKVQQVIITPTSKQTLPPALQNRRVSRRLKSELVDNDPTPPIKTSKTDAMIAPIILAVAPAAIPSSNKASLTAMRHSTARQVKSVSTASQAPTPTKTTMSTPVKPRRPSKVTPRRPTKKRVSRSRTTSKVKKSNWNNGIIKGSALSIPQQPPSGADVTVTQWLEKKDIKMVPNQFASKPSKKLPLLPLLEADGPQGKNDALPIIKRRPSSPIDLMTGLSKTQMNDKLVNPKKVVARNTVRSPRTLFPPTSKDALKLIPQDTATHIIKPEPCTGVASWLSETNVNKKVVTFDDLDITTWEVGMDDTVLDTDDIAVKQGPNEDTANSGEKWSFETRSFFCVDNVDIFHHIKQLPTSVVFPKNVVPDPAMAIVTSRPFCSNNDKSYLEETSGSAPDRATGTDCKPGHSKQLDVLKSLSIKREATTKDQNVVSKSMKQESVPINSKQNEPRSTSGVRVDDSFFLKEEVQDYCRSSVKGSNYIAKPEDKAVKCPASYSDGQYPKLLGSGSGGDLGQQNGKKVERRGSPHSVFADISVSDFTSLVKIPSHPEMDSMVQGPYLDVDDDPLPIDAAVIPPFKKDLAADLAAFSKHRPGYMKAADSKASTKILPAPKLTSVAEANTNNDDKPCPASALFAFQDLPQLPHCNKMGKSKMSKSQCLKELDSFLFDIQQKKSQVESMAKQIGIDLMVSCDGSPTSSSTTADPMGGGQHKQEAQRTIEASS